MLWLCARFPRLPLAVFEAGANDDAVNSNEQPLALVDGRKRIELANSAAMAFGLQPGQSLSTAQALCPALRSRPRNLHAEAQLLRQLALWAYQFTPEIILREPDSLVLRLDHSLRLFRGFHRLYRRLDKGLVRRRQQPVFGLAHTPEAAWLLSHLNEAIEPLVHPEDDQLDISRVEEQLLRVPLHALPCTPAQREMLTAMGLRHLGDVLGLPGKALAKRLGRDFAHWLDRLTGEVADPQRYFEPPTVFYAERHFRDGLHSKPQLHFPIAALLGELGEFLRLRQWRQRELHWQFVYADHQRQNLSMPTSQIRFNRRDLLGLTTLKLEKIELLGSQIDSVSLRCEKFEALETRSGVLFPEEECQQQAEHEEQYLRLLDRLQTQLGAEHCYTPACADSHLPEAAWRRGGQSVLLEESGLRPLWLLQQPLPLTKRGDTLFWQGELQLLQGPERIDSHWWQQRQIRDYYIARRSDGCVCWVYKDCLRKAWFVHGLFS